MNTFQLPQDLPVLDHLNPAWLGDDEPVWLVKNVFPGVGATPATVGDTASAGSAQYGEQAAACNFAGVSRRNMDVG